MKSGFLQLGASFALWTAATAAYATAFNGTPANYQSILAGLAAGDTLNLAAGTYPLLNLNGKNGTASARITIQGPASGAPAIVTINPSNPGCCNIVQLSSTSYLSIRNLTIDSALITGVDGLKAQGPTNDILVEGCTFLGQGSQQQTVGISTKQIAWNWVVRGNTIREAGTGIYFGNSDGDYPFINGVIENNLFIDTIGYNAQIKFQLPYTQPAGLGPGPHRTVIRNNVFIKTRSQASWPAGAADGARPNLLVGGFPTSGYGTNDRYEIYGNFFYDNRDGEPHLQGSGHVAVHGNIFVGGTFRAVSLVNHDLTLRRAYVFNNTVYGMPQGITVSGGSLEDSLVSGNLVFAGSGITAPTQAANIVDTIANAANYVNAPSLTLGAMDFFPKPGMVKGPPLDVSKYRVYRHFDRDFNGDPQDVFLYRGAYAGEGAHRGWVLDGTRKPYWRPAASERVRVRP